MVSAVAVIAALSVIAAACGSSSKGTTPNTNAGPATTAGVTGGVDNAKPVEGGSLVYGLEADTTGGFCLAEAQLAIAGIQVARAIYDTLTAPDADGVIKPFLAKSFSSNANATVWTFNLRSGVTFSDGSPLTATVVKDNLDAYRGTLKPIRSPLLFSFVFSDIKSVAATGPLTVQVTTARPWPALPWFLWSSGRLGIMGEKQLRSPKNCNTDMIGTGPFTKVSWVVNDKFVAKKNPHYWRKDKAGNQLPYLDQITFVPKEDSPTRVQNLEAGDYTMTHLDTPQDIQTIRNDIKAGKLKDVESDKFTEVGYTMFNATKEPFNHLSAREAFSWAIDRDTVNRLRNDNLLTNASGPFPPGNPGYLADTGLPAHADLTKARQFAAQYKQETGKALTFTLTHTTDSTTTKTAELLQQMLNTAGIKVSLNPVADQSTLINLAIARGFQAALWRNHPGADPDTQYVWWHCDNSPPAGTDPNGAAPCDNPVNFGGFNDPVINKDLELGRTSLDPAKRVSYYEDLNREFAKQLWNGWGQWVLWTVAFKPTVHGILGPDLPDGSKPFTGLPTGHPVDGLWCDNGKC